MTTSTVNPFSVRSARAKYIRSEIKLFTNAQLQQLQDNFVKNNEIMQYSSDTIDFIPVIKLFTPWGAATWLLSELDPDNIAFGLYDLGQGYPELGYISIAEILSIRGPFGLTVERDLSFEADKTLWRLPWPCKFNNKEPEND